MMLLRVVTLILFVILTILVLIRYRDVKSSSMHMLFLMPYGLGGAIFQALSIGHSLEWWYVSPLLLNSVSTWLRIYLISTGIAFITAHSKEGP